MTSTAGKYILNEAADWETWKRGFDNQVAIQRFEPYINGEEPFPEAPQKPRRPSTPDFQEEPQERPIRRAGNRSQTEESLTQASTTSSTTTKNPIKERYDYKLKRYELDIQAQREQRHHFEKFEKSREKLENWIADTVNPQIQAVAIKAGADLKTKVEELEVYFNRDSRTVTKELRQRYAAITKERTAWPKDIQQWTNEWLKVMALGKQYDQLFAKDHYAWTEDFYKTWSKIDPGFVSVNSQIRNKEIDQGTITYHDLIKDLIDHYKRTRPGKSQSGFSRGSFQTQSKQNRKSMREKSSEDADEESPQENALKPSKLKKRPSSKSLSQPEKRTGPVCVGCEMAHPPHSCWYLWPELARDDWVPRKVLKQLTEKNMRDPNKRKEVESLKKNFRHLKNLTILEREEDSEKNHDNDIL
jgi:hypothetical protein